MIEKHIRIFISSLFLLYTFIFPLLQRYCASQMVVKTKRQCTRKIRGNHASGVIEASNNIGAPLYSLSLSLSLSLETSRADQSSQHKGIKLRQSIWILVTRSALKGKALRKIKCRT